MTSDGYVISRHRDGGLQIEIDMHGTPWPYDPLSWAAMLPGVGERLAGALSGREPSISLCMFRSRPRRTVDAVLEIGNGQVRVYDLHTRVAHRVQLGARLAGTPRRRLQLFAGLVYALLCAEGTPVRIVSGCERQPARLVS